MDDNMKLYNAVRNCPENAQKEIKAGRLKGMSDINPMWRIQMLTEQFGACGVGWYYDIVKQWTENGANGEKAAFVNIDLYVKIDGEWSKPIQGTGGSMLIANERSGAHTSDECYKMALTDAISVACKALGFAADVYWQAGRTKYSADEEREEREDQYKCVCCGKPFKDTHTKTGEFYTAAQAYHMTEKKYGRAICIDCRKKEGIQN
ncbi:MAG: hypothetical protein II388_01205 [Clostridia bacterium]|nr:hypothetical protein [Clostridia bacterium]